MSGVRLALCACLTICFVVLAAVGISSAQIQPPFNTSYTLTNLGAAPGVPTPYGGLTFADSNNLSLVGCSEDSCAGAVYQVSVTRNASGHVSGFSGSATFVASVSDAEGGLQYGPGGVLFYVNSFGQLGEIKPGSNATNKLADLQAAGVCGPRVTGLEVAPNGEMKVLDLSCATVYTLSLTPDGSGTYDVPSVTSGGSLSGTSVNFAYVANGSPMFTQPSMLDTDWASSSLSAYAADSNYNPTGTAQLFANISQAFGSTVDPVTNDILVSTFNGQIYLITGFAAPGPQGAVSFSPASLNAKNVVVGTIGTAMNATLTNTGAGPLQINQILASGNYSETDTCAGTIVAASANCIISVTFSPTVAGTVPGVITIYDDSPGSPHVLAVTGKGIYPVTTSPTSASFGSVVVGSTSAGKTITVTNNTGSTVTFTTAASTNFAATPTGAKPCNGTLAAKASCTVSATFSPTANGAIQGAFSVAGTGFATQTATLTGTGTGGGTSPLSFSPATVGLASTLVGATSAAKTLTVTNSSATAVTLTDFSASADFSVVGTGANPCGGALGAGANCTVAVTFTPPLGGKISGGLAFFDSAAVGTQVVAVSGTGLLPVAFTPSSLTFASQTVGTTSAAKVVTITNNQSVTLNFSEISASGDYAVSPGTSKPCGATLAAKAKCTIQVTFTPTHTGTITGTVTVSHDAVGSAQVIGLSGKGQ